MTTDAETPDEEKQETPPAEEKQEAAAHGSAPRPRSDTSYPYYPITKCFEIVNAVQRCGGTEAVNSEVQKELGISKNDRVWAYGVPASVYFGLVERVGRGDDGKLRVTDLATQITHPSTEEEARAAKIAAVSKPELYAKLLERFAGKPLPTKDGLRNLLIREFKIVESMAPIAAEAFLESIKIAEMVTPTNVLISSQKRAVESPSAPAIPQPASSEAHTGGENTQTLTVPADFIIYRCKISGGRVIEIPLPSKFNQADRKRLDNFLQTQVDDEEVEAS